LQRSASLMRLYLPHVASRSHFSQGVVKFPVPQSGIWFSRIASRQTRLPSSFTAIELRLFTSEILLFAVVHYIAMRMDNSISSTFSVRYQIFLTLQKRMFILCVVSISS